MINLDTETTQPWRAPDLPYTDTPASMPKKRCTTMSKFQTFTTLVFIALTWFVGIAIMILLFAP